VLAALSLVAVLVLLSGVFSGPSSPRDSGPLPTLDGITNVSRIEPLFSAAAGDLVGRTVEVRCWSAPQWAVLTRQAFAYKHVRLGPEGGYASYDHHLVNLAPRICEHLDDVAYRRFVPTTYADRYWVSWSLQTLALDAFQLARTKNAAEAECYALQSIARLATRLGLDRLHAQALARLYWRRIYFELAPDYRSPMCVNGGDFDLRPDTSAWP
jgi:hypothetical protein